MTHVTHDVSIQKLKIEPRLGGAVLRVMLSAPKGNVLDAGMTAELREVFRGVQEEPGIKAVLLLGEGAHFSFGASVEEHQPEQVRAMLHAFHGLFRQILDSGVVLLSAVRGACLGGGLELAAFSQRLFAHPESKFGQPEIKLGVFAPIASLILPERIGRSAAEDLLLSGRTIKAAEALELGLIDQVDEDPEAAAMGWAEEHLLPHSSSSLRFASRAARLELSRCFDERIQALERLYLDHLMASLDAREGIAAFLAKREPNWSDA